MSRSELITGAKAQDIDHEKRIATISLSTSDGASTILDLTLPAAGQLTNVLMQIMASAYQKRAGGPSPVASELEFAVPVEVNQISVYPDVSGTELAVWFEKDASFRLLWSLNLDLAHQMITMLQRGIEQATSQSPGLDVRLS